MYHNIAGDFGIGRNAFFGSTGSYINFEVAEQQYTGVFEHGYGFRVYQGRVQFKHRDGTWKDIGSGTATGIQGETGSFGVTGLVGATGVQGSTGIQGITGIQGFTGVQGSTGLGGPTGTPGLTGLQGFTGVEGLGTTGLAGPTGSQGTTGLRGFTGPAAPEIPLYSTRVNTWTPTTQGLYYHDIQHDLNKWDLIVEVSEYGTGRIVDPGSMEKLSPDTLRLYVTDNTLDLEVVIDVSGSSGGSSTGIFGGGGLTWVIISSDTNASLDMGYLVDASGGDVTLTLPASPTTGDIVGISDYTKSAETNSILISGNGNNIEGSASNLQVDVNGAGFHLTYTDSAVGWKITTEISGGGISGSTGVYNDSYTPAGSTGVWEWPLPSTQTEALDRLAAALSTHLGVPIPVIAGGSEIIELNVGDNFLLLEYASVDTDSIVPYYWNFTNDDTSTGVTDWTEHEVNGGTVTHNTSSGEVEILSPTSQQLFSTGLSTGNIPHLLSDVVIPDGDFVVRAKVTGDANTRALFGIRVSHNYFIYAQKQFSTNWDSILCKVSNAVRTIATNNRTAVDSQTSWYELKRIGSNIYLQEATSLSDLENQTGSYTILDSMDLSGGLEASVSIFLSCDYIVGTGISTFDDVTIVSSAASPTSATAQIRDAGVTYIDAGFGREIDLGVLDSNVTGGLGLTWQYYWSNNPGDTPTYNGSWLTTGQMQAIPNTSSYRYLWLQTKMDIPNQLSALEHMFTGSTLPEGVSAWSHNTATYSFDGTGVVTNTNGNDRCGYVVDTYYDWESNLVVRFTMPSTEPVGSNIEPRIWSLTDTGPYKPMWARKEVGYSRLLDHNDSTLVTFPEDVPITIVFSLTPSSIDATAYDSTGVLATSSQPTTNRYSDTQFYATMNNTSALRLEYMRMGGSTAPEEIGPLSYSLDSVSVGAEPSI